MKSSQAMKKKSHSSGGHGTMSKITLFWQQSTKLIISLVNRFTIVTDEGRTDSYLRTMDLCFDTTNTTLSVSEFG